jgi:hypothetical protein
MEPDSGRGGDSSASHIIQSVVGLMGRSTADEWTVTADQVASVVGEVEYYRAAYALGLHTVASFDSGTVASLGELLSHLCGEDAESALRHAGFLLTTDERLELTERLVRRIRVAVVLHVAEPDTFRAMLSALRRYDRALQTYLDTYLDTGPICESCAQEYVDVHVHDHQEESAQRRALLLGTVRRYLRRLLDRRVIEVVALAPALIELLATVARHEGYLPRHEESNQRPGVGGDHQRSYGEGAESEHEALSVLGLRHGAGQNEIRTRYRELMRRYHPDINPSGLETAKKITVAYGLLSGE